MLDCFQKVTCSNCKKERYKFKTINYAGFTICSEKCMYEFFEGITSEELIELDIKDRIINQDFYAWIYNTKKQVRNKKLTKKK